MTPHSAPQGLSIAILGPTFPNLAANVGKNVSDIYYIFVGRSLGSLAGSVVGGVLFDCMNAALLLGECCAAGPVGAAPAAPRERSPEGAVPPVGGCGEGPWDAVCCPRVPARCRHVPPCRIADTACAGLCCSAASLPRAWARRRASKGH